jgi:fused signal recognition particle receptor
MFDGLKDKLNTFAEEAEGDVEVPDEDATDAEAAVDADTAESDDAADTADANEQVAADEDAQDDSSGAAPAHSAAGQAFRDDLKEGNVEPAGVDADAPTSEDHPAESEADEAGEDDETVESAEDEGGRGLTEKAKLLASGKTVIDEDDLADHLEELEFALLRSDVELDVAEEILDGVEENLVGETRRRLSSTGNLVQDALREALYDVISVGQFDFDQRIQEADKPVVIIFTGVNGVGKTTSIAKLSQYFEDRGLSTVLANGDTYRAGANEQLEQHADNLGKKIISHEKGSDPTAVIYDAVEYAEANDVDVVLGDTAGRLHTDAGLMDQLDKIDRVIDPDMTLFVDEAVAGQDAVNRAAEFDDASDIDGTILTKADADTQGGAAISISHVTGKPILFLGTGQDYDDLERFDPEKIVDALI